MIRRRTALTFLLALGLASPVSAVEPDPTVTPAQLQSAMAGNWTGALGYRDYQTNELFELPVETKISAVPDGVTIVRVSNYDDGPKTGIVYITTTAFFEAPDRMTSFVARKGRALETLTDTVRVTAYADPTHWTITYERSGTDGNSPARIRTTEVRDGDSVLAKKEVMPLSETAKGWQFRNQLRLTRAPG
jgi:hypothetical protein